jgi:hypothetical protein
LKVDAIVTYVPNELQSVRTRWLRGQLGWEGPIHFVPGGAGRIGALQIDDRPYVLVDDNPAAIRTGVDVLWPQPWTTHLSKDSTELWLRQYRAFCRLLTLQNSPKEQHGTDRLIDDGCTWQTAIASVYNGQTSGRDQH